MGLSLLDVVVLVVSVYAISRVVCFFIDSNQESIRKKKEHDRLKVRLKTLEKFYERDK